MRISKCLVVICVLIVLLLSSCTEKKQDEKIYHVGILSALDIFVNTTDGFKDRMTELGYIENKNIVYDIQKANAPVGNENIIKKFVGDKVDLIFVFPTEAALETKATTKGTGIPIVFAHAVIEGTNLVENLRTPGEDITGVRFPAVENALKRLELLHEVVPNAKRVWMPYLKGYSNLPPQLDALRQSARSLGITLTEAPFTGAEELQADLATRNNLRDVGMDAILCIIEPLLTSPDALIPTNEFADKHKIPLFGAPVRMEGSSSILETTPDFFETGQLAAEQADRIFSGMPAGNLPVVSPESHIYINYKAAQRLGLDINEGLLVRADEIIR